MNRILPSLLLSLFCVASQAAVYKWVDSSGRVHFSDTPGEGAERIELSEPTIYTPANSSGGGQGSSGGSSRKAADPSADYSLFEIIEPDNNGSILANDGTVTVQFMISPGLQQGHYIQFVLDGRILDQHYTSPTVTLTGLERGLHMIHASIHDSVGRMYSRSNIVQFIVRQESVITDGKSPELKPPSYSGSSNVDSPVYDAGQRTTTDKYLDSNDPDSDKYIAPTETDGDKYQAPANTSTDKFGTAPRTKTDKFVAPSNSAGDKFKVQ
jgi:hypothetical protein